MQLLKVDKSETKSNPEITTKNKAVPMETETVKEVAETPANNDTEENTTTTKEQANGDTPNAGAGTVLTPKKKKNKKRKKKNKKPNVANNGEEATTQEQNQGQKRENTDAPSQPSKKQKLSQNQVDCSELKVFFPPGANSYKDTLLKLLEDCDVIRNPRTLILKYESTEGAKKKIPTLENVEIEGKKVTVKQLIEDIFPLKRSVYLKRSYVEYDTVKTFYKAESIEPITYNGRPTGLHCLTFNTEEAAEEASKERMKEGELDLLLKPYFEKRKSALTNFDEECENKKTECTELQVYFPAGANSYKEALIELAQNAEVVRNPRTLILKYETAEAARLKIPILQEIDIEGKHLTVNKKFN